jgi:hypothetical protein
VSLESSPCPPSSAGSNRSESSVAAVAPLVEFVAEVGEQAVVQVVVVEVVVVVVEEEEQKEEVVVVAMMTAVLW